MPGVRCLSDAAKPGGECVEERVWHWAQAEDQVRIRLKTSFCFVLAFRLCTTGMLYLMGAPLSSLRYDERICVNGYHNRRWVQ